MSVLTKEAIEIFDPVDGSGNARGPDMGEVQTWGTEIEARLDNVDELPSFRAHKNATDQTGIVTATPTPVTFGTESFDLGGYYNTSTSRYTPPAGKYLFAALVTFTAGIVDQSTYFIYLYKNGGVAARANVVASGTGQIGAPLTAVLDADGDDYFEVYCLGNGTGNKTLSGNEIETFFSAAKLDSITGDIGAQGPNVGLDYAFNTATSGDPGSGKVLVNNATQASITQINISETNRQAVSQAAFLALQDDSTASVMAIVRILDVAAPGANFIDLAITGALTDAGGYDTFPVSYVGHGGTIANAAVVAVVFFRTGNNGANGSNGADGADPGILLNWDTGTTDADPGTGELRANNASLASATLLYISKTSRAGSDIAAFLAALDDSTNTVRGTLVLTKTSDETQASFAVGAVTDATGYIKLAVSGHSGATSFTAADAISFQFSRAGDGFSSATLDALFGTTPNLFITRDGSAWLVRALAASDIPALDVGSLATTTTNDNAATGGLGEYVTGGAIGTQATVTISNASPAVITETGHAHEIGSVVNLTTTGGLPTGLSVGTNYYVSATGFGANSYSLSLSPADAFAGTNVNTSSAGSGTQTVNGYAVMTTVTDVSLVGIQLGAGDWDVNAQIVYVPGATTTVNSVQASISTVHNTRNTDSSVNTAMGMNAVTLVNSTTVVNGPWRMSLASPTIVYLIARSNFGTSTMISYGRMRARRVR